MKVPWIRPVSEEKLWHQTTNLACSVRCLLLSLQRRRYNLTSYHHSDTSDNTGIKAQRDFGILTHDRGLPAMITKCPCIAHCLLPTSCIEVKVDCKGMFANNILGWQQKCQVVLMLCWLRRHFLEGIWARRVDYNKGATQATQRKNLPWEVLKLVSHSCAARHLFCPFLHNIFELFQNSYHNFAMEDRAMRQRSFGPYLHLLQAEKV